MIEKLKQLFKRNRKIALLKIACTEQGVEIDARGNKEALRLAFAMMLKNPQFSDLFTGGKPTIN